MGMTDEERRLREKLRMRERRANETPEQRKHRLEQSRDYNRERRAMLKELGIGSTEEERKYKREWTKRKYHENAKFRQSKKQKAREHYRNVVKPRREEEGFQRRLAMSRAAREILNY